jgi:perosamine synthetase
VEPKLNLAAERVIRVAKPWITAGEVSAVLRAIIAGQISGGPAVAEFEQQFAASHAFRHGIACNSGGTALRLALAAAGVGFGCRVVTSTMTMTAVANAIVDAGADPVFVDCGHDGNINLSKAIGAAWTVRASAVILPHLYGVPINYNKYEFPCTIIEDCAEAHYAAYRDTLEPVGSEANFACFSFYGNKIIACGEGGMVLCNETVDEKRLRSLRAYAFSETEHFHHREHGFGYRMTEMQGALGLAQHSRYGEILARRDAIAQLYRQHLDGLPIDIDPEIPGRVWWVFPCRFNDERLTRDHARAALHAAGVETRTYFKPLHRQPHLLRFTTGSRDFYHADRLYACGLYLPLYPEMTEEDVGYIAGVLRRLL